MQKHDTAPRRGVPDDGWRGRRSGAPHDRFAPLPSLINRADVADGSSGVVSTTHDGEMGP